MDYTLCPKKVVHQSHGNNFVNSQRIFKILSLLERELNCQQNPCNTCHHTFSCRTTSRNLAVRICGNFQKKQSKNRVIFDKNWNVSCHMADYCHNSCLKCPPFARIDAQRRPRHSVALSMMVWSMPCQICRKRCFSSQHLFRQNRIFNKEYLTWTGNWNDK